MNRKAIIGTIIWSLIVFLLVSAFIFYVTFKDRSSKSAPPATKQTEEISVQEVTNKIGLAILARRQALFR